VSPQSERLKGVHGLYAPAEAQLRTLRQEKTEEELQPTNMKA